MPVDSRQPESLWFLDTLVSVRIPAAAGADGISILEHRARRGDSPPLHVHWTEDEIFHLIQGEVVLRLSDEDRLLKAGEMLLAPRGRPHSYRVESEVGARWLTITGRGDFERFVRAMSRPAQGEELPPSLGPPTEEAIARLVQTAAAHNIDVVGPPLLPG